MEACIMGFAGVKSAVNDGPTCAGWYQVISSHPVTVSGGHSQPFMRRRIAQSIPSLLSISQKAGGAREDV